MTRHTPYQRLLYRNIMPYSLIVAMLLSANMGYTQTQATPPMEYTVSINTDQNAPEQIKKLLNAAKSYIESVELPEEADENYVHYQISQNNKYIKQLLQSQGYFDAESKMNYDQKTYVALFDVSLGKRYTYGSISIKQNALSKNTQDISHPDLASLKAQSGKPVVTENVYDDERTITSWVEDKHCLFTHTTKHQAIINHLKHEVNIIYTIDYGQKVHFSDVTFTGDTSVSDTYLKQHIAVQPGDCFTRSKLNAVESKLKSTNLFSDITTQIPETPKADGSIPLDLQLEYGKQHTIKAGASFSTDIGPGVNLGWEDRNFFSSGEKLSVNLTLTPLERRLDTQLSKPYFLGVDQRFTIGGTIFQKDNDAFVSDGFKLNAGIDRTIAGWDIGVGGSYGFEQITDQNGTDDVALLSLPIFASKDTRDNPLNPTEGWTLKLNSSPSLDTINTNSIFVKNQLGTSYFHALTEERMSILAVRMALGSIWGSSTDSVPATERFYVGGANSIRGYAYQSAGPLDAQNDPLGGRALFEISTELRMRLINEYGLVLFLDGGNVYNDNVPDFQEELLWGGGLGFRYFTDFGPIRADVAFPLNRRDNVDDAFQVYFSIGQAF